VPSEHSNSYDKSRLESLSCCKDLQIHTFSRGVAPGVMSAKAGIPRDFAQDEATGGDILIPGNNWSGDV